MHKTHAYTKIYPSIRPEFDGIKHCGGSQAGRITYSIRPESVQHPSSFNRTIRISPKRQTYKSSVLHSNSSLLGTEITGTSSRLQIIDVVFSPNRNVSLESKQDVGRVHRLPSVNVPLPLPIKLAILKTVAIAQVLGVTND